MKMLSVLLYLCSASIAVSAVVIQEVYYDQPGADGDAVFTELRGTPGLSLDGWSLVGINQDGATYRSVHLMGGIIPLDGMFVISTANAEPSLSIVSDLIGNIDWQNGPGDTIELRDESNALIDALRYGEFGVDGYGEGSPAIGAAEGFSLSRDEMGTDTNDNALDFRAVLPTPGLGPDPVPEPVFTALCLVGLMCLMRRRRCG